MSSQSGGLNMDLEILLELYQSGLSIKDIAFEMEESVDFVLTSLREYKASQKNKGQYSEELMRVIAKRDSHDIMRKDIMQELNVSRSFLSKSIEKFGFLNKLNSLDGEEVYKKVPKNFELTECPQCHSKKINEVNSLYKEFPVKGIYCFDCGNEFFKRENEVYKVKWENID